MKTVGQVSMKSSIRTLLLPTLCAITEWSKTPLVIGGAFEDGVNGTPQLQWQV